MIAVELEFESTTERMDARPAHRAILERLKQSSVLHAAGPWADDSGALLLFDADRETVESVMRDDPYYSTPGVSIRSVREWTPIVGP